MQGKGGPQRTQRQTVQISVTSVAILVRAGNGVPGVQSSLVDMGSRGRISQGKDRTQASNEGVLHEAVSTDRRAGGASSRPAVEQ